jgi:hypothetical protein
MSMGSSSPLSAEVSSSVSTTQTTVSTTQTTSGLLAWFRANVGIALFIVAVVNVILVGIVWKVWDLVQKLDEVSINSLNTRMSSLDTSLNTRMSSLDTRIGDIKESLREAKENFRTEMRLTNEAMKAANETMRATNESMKEQFAYVREDINKSLNQTKEFIKDEVPKIRKGTDEIAAKMDSELSKIRASELKTDAELSKSTSELLKIQDSLKRVEGVANSTKAKVGEIKSVERVFLESYNLPTDLDVRFFKAVFYVFPRDEGRKALVLAAGFIKSDDATIPKPFEGAVAYRPRQPVSRGGRQVRHQSKLGR